MQRLRPQIKVAKMICTFVVVVLTSCFLENLPFVYYLFNLFALHIKQLFFMMGFPEDINSLN